MASINRLAIRGIRSFSPNDEEQCVEFYFPFTVIAGSNGCGKTTIIEALKYGITGSLPPGGAKAGQHFVHDPRAMDTTQVKAQVKLRFTSSNSQTMVVVRSMEVTQKKTNATFKQLDGALRTYDQMTGERVTLSHKCSELDKQIPSLLGVSKPILDHVLFCHQEDSSWPLSEASVLKKRFDEIFDSSRYTKAIGIFKQLEKEFNGKVKDLFAEQTGLSSHQHAAHGFRKELAEATEAEEELDDEKKYIDTELAKVQETIDGLNDIAMQVSTVGSEFEAAQQEKQHQMALVLRLRSMLEENMTQQHSVRELEKILREYDAKVSNQQEEWQDLKDRDTEFDQVIAKLRGKEIDLTQEKARLDADRETYEKNCRDRYQLMESIAQSYSVDLTQGGGAGSVNMSMDASFAGAGDHSIAGLSQGSILEISSDDMQAVMEMLQKKEEELKATLQETVDMHQTNEDKMLKDLAELRASRSSIEAEREKLNTTRRDYNQELKELSGKTEGPVRVRKSDVEDIRRRVEKLVKQRDQANKDPRREEIPTEIRRLEEKVDSIKRQIDDDKIALDGLRMCSDAENQIAMLREQCAKDLDLLEENIRDNSFSLGKFNLQPAGNLPSYDDNEGRDLVSYVETFYDKARAEHAKSKTAASKAEDEASKCQRTINEMIASSTSKQQSLQSSSARVEALRGGAVAKIKATVDELRAFEKEEGYEPPSETDPIQTIIDYVDERIKEVNDDSPLDDVDYSKKLLKKLRKLAKKKTQEGQTNEVRCPCCARAMDDEEYGVFKETLHELSVESALVQIDDAAVQEHNEKKESLAKWRKILADNVSHFREFERLQKDVASSETEVQRLVDEIATQKTTITRLNDKATEKRNEMEEVRELVDLCRRWTEDAHRIKDKRMQINQKNDELTVTQTSGRDLRTVERDLETKSNSKEDMIQQINKLNKEMTELNNRVANLATQTSQLENVLREKEAKWAETEKATERKNELLVSLQKMKEEEAQLQDQLVPLTRRIEVKTREKERLRTTRETEVSERQTVLLDFQSEVKDLRRLTSIIEQFLASGKLQHLEDHSEKVTALLRKIEGKQKEKDDLAPRLAEAAASVENQERYKKLLSDNINFIKEEERIKEMEEKMERLEEELNAIEGSENVNDRLEEATKAHQEFLSKKARIEGRRMEVVEKIRSVKRKLSTDEYKDVDEQLRVTNIKFNTTKMASADLKKYYVAVEQALLRYHTVKIAEINKIIQELWLLVYKGEDISSIEIESGADQASSGKKTYNYRVVMTKNNNRNVKIDMKGRCSAGQRVLACIVIRLALAETFGVKCGTLALDEPTVNLDYRNKKGLAIALAQIIALRSKQSNFQLIMITHDEEFVSMMKTELAAHSNFSMPEKFFRVHREMEAGGRYYSKITATDWEEIV